MQWLKEKVGKTGITCQLSHALSIAATNPSVHHSIVVSQTKEEHFNAHIHGE